MAAMLNKLRAVARATRLRRASFNLYPGLAAVTRSATIHFHFPTKCPTTLCNSGKAPLTVLSPFSLVMSSAVYRRHMPTLRSAYQKNCITSSWKSLRRSLELRQV